MAGKSLEDTFIYKHLNSSDGISKGALSALTQGIPLSKANVEEAFFIINKNFKYPLKLKVMEAVEDGLIKLVYSPSKTRLPTCLPFFLTKDNSGRIVAVVLVDMYGKLNTETSIVNIDAKKLYCIMESALLARAYFTHAQEISKRSIIINSGSSIYSNLFTRVLNKRYALNVDKSKMNKVLFLASKFYMINVLGLSNNESVMNYAIKNCPNANPFSLKEINDMVADEDYKDLSTFIAKLKDPELGLGFKDLTVRGYLESYITMYDASALLALEHFSYFLYTIMSVVNGAYLNQQYVLEDIVDRHGAKIYADLLDFVR